MMLPAELPYIESNALERPRQAIAAAIPPFTAPRIPPPSIARLRIAVSLAARDMGVDCEWYLWWRMLRTSWVNIFFASVDAACEASQVGKGVSSARTLPMSCHSSAFGSSLCSHSISMECGYSGSISFAIKSNCTSSDRVESDVVAECCSFFDVSRDGGGE